MSAPPDQPGKGDSPPPFTRPERRQLARFCLYGFLKNQQYYEPFLFLAFLDRGLSFTAIGTLIAFRSVCVNVLEIPSGAVADVLGRRRSMIASMIAYIASFALLAFAGSFAAFLPAMLLFAAGEAFRTGTHKAMIFDWLARAGRSDERTRVYGLTRSWSKLGSALSVVLAAGIVLATRDYRWVFLLAIAPYAANGVNFLLYPSELDGGTDEPRSVRRVARVLLDGLRLALRRGPLRALLVESVCFEGVYGAAKDYLQPLLKTMAATTLAGLAGLTFFVAGDDLARTAVLVAAVYLPLNLAGSFASRSSHRAARAAGDEDRLALALWLVALALYALTGAGLALGVGALAVAGFALLAVVQNVWRPTLVSRFHSHAPLESAATTLSVESQAKNLGLALVAPALGAAVDRVRGGGALTLETLWPVAAAGALACLAGLAINLVAHGRHMRPGAHAEGPEGLDKASV